MNGFVLSIALCLYISFYFYASTSPLEHYKDIAQAPGTGVHKHRIFKDPIFGIIEYPITGNGFALIDVAATGLLSLLLAYLFRWNWYTVFVGLVFISVPVHMLFGVETNLMKLFVT
jgi:hypothetical protein